MSFSILNPPLYVPEEPLNEDEHDFDVLQHTGWAVPPAHVQPDGQDKHELLLK